MPFTMDRISLESSHQYTCDKDYLLSSQHGMQSDDDEQARSRQYRPCSRCASRMHQRLMVLPWILSAALLVCLVVVGNRTPHQCGENMFWRELEFGIFFFLLVSACFSPALTHFLILHIFSLLTVSNVLQRRHS